jgi:pimeloyl-ACP methyl ester carboxylesterase
MIAPRAHSAIHRAAWFVPALAVVAAALLGAAPSPRPLAASDTGRGEPCIVLVHGIGVDRSAWDAVTKQLAARHRVLAVDLPGHGLSEAVDSVRVDRIADALDATLEKHKIQRAILVGHSYGGLVALAEAAAHPKRACGVAVIDIGAYLRVDPERVADLDRLMTEHYPLFVIGVFESMSADSSVREVLKARARAVPQAVLSAYFRDAWHADLRTSVKRLESPLLVVASAQLWPASQSWDSVRVYLGYDGAPRATGKRILQTGHFIPLDQPDSLATALESFATGLR